MDNLFLLLFLVSLLGLVAGLIKPDIFKKIFKENATRKRVGLVFGSVSLVSFILFGLTADSVPQTKDVAVETNTTVPSSIEAQTNKPEVETKTEQKTEIAYSFDVPAFITKNVDEITKILGTASNDTEPTQEQLKLGTKEWDKTWTKDGNTLLVTYNPTTRKVVDFFVQSAKNDPDGLTRDKQLLLDIGNFKMGDSRYRIEFVESLKDRSGYTGVKITPNN